METIFAEAKWSEHFEESWQEVYDTFIKVPTTEDYDLNPGKINTDRAIEYLCKEHDFTEERVKKGIEELTKKNQRGLNDFF